MAGPVGRLPEGRRRPFAMGQGRKKSASGLLRGYRRFSSFGRAQGNDCARTYRSGRFHSDPDRRPARRKIHGLLRQAASLHRTGDRRRADARAATRLRHRETEGGTGAQRRRRACAAARVHRGILRRCDHQQGSGRDHPDLESGRRAAVRLYRRRGHRQARDHSFSAGPRRRGARDPRAHTARRAHPPL